MDDAAEDRALRNGVPIQVHAYISPTPSQPPASHGARIAAPDSSTLRVRDGKIVELVSGSDVIGLSVDHAYHQPPGTECDVLERSLQPIVKASVEGVNTAVLAVGASRSNKTDLLFRKMDQQSLITAVFQSLVATLEAKATTMEASGAKGARPRFRFSLRVAVVELYEETISDLLSGQFTSERQIRGTSTVVDGRTSFKRLDGVSFSPPLASVSAFRPLIEAARQARRKDNGLYGNASAFSSAIVRIQIQQTFEFLETDSQQLISTFDIVDLPPTDRLANSGGMVRLAEGPLLNKSLHALSDCITALSTSSTDSVEASRQAPFDESYLTQLLQDTLGANCLTFAMLFLAPGDLNGSRATLQLGKRMQSVKNFPVVNNDVIRGLLHKYFTHLALVKQGKTLGSQLLSQRNTMPGDDRVYITKIHDLEGRVAQEVLEKRLLKEDKDKLVSVMNELKSKYQQLFDNEIEIRTELLVCEQEKLTLSKAFVDFQMEKNAQMQDLDNEKFELETKLIQAEEMLVHIQQDDVMKAAQIQDLCQKMNEIIQEKRVLGEELALLQKHSHEVEQAAAHERKKNQQLSLELIVLVNQKQKSMADMEQFEQRSREVMKQNQDKDMAASRLQRETDELKARIAELDMQVESTRKEVARKEIEVEKLELSTRKVQLEFEKKSEGLTRDRESDSERALARATAEVSLLANEKALLQQQLERSEAELKKSGKEKEDLLAAWMAKSQENEDLLVANERLRHENQSQVEEFRLQLSFSTTKADSQSGMGDLLQSYQRRERDLRAQVTVQQQQLHRLKKQLTASQRVSNVLPVEDTIPETRDAVGDDAVIAELNDVRERLRVAELKCLQEMELASQIAAERDQLQHAVETLEQQHKELQAQQQQSRQSDNASLEVTRQMQTLILAQLEEVRRLSLQQHQDHSDKMTQLRTPAAPPPIPRDEGPPNANNGEPGQVQVLITEKKQLEQKLAAEWMQAVEQVERRCADLLTKNVMLTEENEQLRQTLKSLIARIHAKR